jgi:hypothetical protein
MQIKPTCAQLPKASIEGINQSKQGDIRPQSQKAGFALRDARHIAFPIAQPPDDVVSQLHEKPARRRKVKRFALPLEKLDSVSFSTSRTWCETASWERFRRFPALVGFPSRQSHQCFR